MAAWKASENIAQGNALGFVMTTIVALTGLTGQKVLIISSFALSGRQ